MASDLDVFAVAAPGRDQLDARDDPSRRPAAEVQRFRSRPDLRPPAVTVTAQLSGDRRRATIFVAPYTGPGQAGPMILDPAGGLLWFKPLPAHTFATNLRVQEYAGQAGADVVAGRHLGARLRASAKT